MSTSCQDKNSYPRKANIERVVRHVCRHVKREDLINDLRQELVLRCLCGNIPDNKLVSLAFSAYREIAFGQEFPHDFSNDRTTLLVNHSRCKSKPKYNMSLVPDVWKMRAFGKTWKEIGSALGGYSLTWMYYQVEHTIHMEIPVDYKTRNIVIASLNASRFYHTRKPNYRRLKPGAIGEIKQLLKAGMTTVSELAKKFNIHNQTVYRINRGELHHDKNLKYPLRKATLTSNPLTQFKKGALNINSKLNESKVIKMRSLHSQGRTIAALARDFHVSATVAGYAIKGKTWKHVNRKEAANGQL